MTLAAAIVRRRTDTHAPLVLAFGMMRDYEKEEWVQRYQSALFELEHALMSGRLVDARAAIVKRVERLRDIPELHGEERRAIDDALRNLCVLEQEDVQYAADEQRKAGQKALEKLGTLDPTIQWLKSGQSRATSD